MIRRSLPAVKVATYCILLPNQKAGGAIVPNGSGFLVSPGGHLVTARHVITENDQADGPLRGDLDKAMLICASRPGIASHIRIDAVLADDESNDFALLGTRPEMEPWATDDSPDLGEIAEIIQARAIPVQLTTRPLDDGEPVYTFGYPLGTITDLSGYPGISAPAGTMGPIIRPRVTSAIIAGRFDMETPMRHTLDRVIYAIDKPINPGNSGGPVIATETGKCFGICSAYQYMPVSQPHFGAIPICPGAPPVRHVNVPSLYGLVTSLASPAILTILDRLGIAHEQV